MILIIIKLCTLKNCYFKFHEVIVGIARILIIESDIKLIENLSKALQAHGDEIQQCTDKEQGVHTALTTKFDLILLGINSLVEDETKHVCRIRDKKSTPIMILANDNSVEQRIKFLEQGVDDYLAKPVNITELKLRINVLLQRHKPTRQNTSIISVDQLTLHKMKQEVNYDGHDLLLTPIQFRLLWMLVQNRNQTLTKPYLYKSILDREFYPYDRSLEMHLSRVRKKLIDKGMSAERLKTLHGKGYCFS